MRYQTLRLWLKYMCMGQTKNHQTSKVGILLMGWPNLVPPNLYVIFKTYYYFWKSASIDRMAQAVYLSTYIQHVVLLFIMIPLFKDTGKMFALRLAFSSSCRGLMEKNFLGNNILEETKLLAVGTLGSWQVAGGMWPNCLGAVRKAGIRCPRQLVVGGGVES